MESIKSILTKTQTIAVIGLKTGETDDAFKIPNYMYRHNYIIFPVNPKLAGQEVFGMLTVSKVTELITPIDLVNIFRKPENLYKHADEILQMKVLPRYVWFQLGIYNDEAAKRLEKSGITVVQNRCIMVEHSRLNY